MNSVRLIEGSKRMRLRGESSTSPCPGVSPCPAPATGGERVTIEAPFCWYASNSLALVDRGLRNAHLGGLLLFKEHAVFGQME